MIFFTSDLHLGHANIIRLCNRPFADVEEMDRSLIERWNRKVKESDIVYLVGDIVWDKRKVPGYMEQLRGRKILISSGNHDAPWANKEAYAPYVESRIPYLETKINGHLVTLCHYPLLEWKDSRELSSKRQSYLIHGHIHNRISDEYRPIYLMPHALNAGFDINGFEPVTFDQLFENNRNFKLRALSENGDRDWLAERYRHLDEAL